MLPTAALVLALAVPAAPAPKADPGLPADLIDLLPEDTAGVLVVDVPRTVQADVGRTILKLFDTLQRPGEPLHIADLGPEAESVLLAQFLIDKAAGDFALIVRLKDGSGYGKALIAKAKGDRRPAEEIGARTVYSLNRPEVGVALIDDRTLMFVLATGTPAQVRETRRAAFGGREKPGPPRGLRTLIEEGAKDDRAIRLYGHHPKKVALSAVLPLTCLGVQGDAVADLGDKLVSFRGGIRMGEAGEVELRFTAKDADAAKALVKAYNVVEGNLAPFVKEFRAGARVVREGDEVVVTARLTTATVELIGEKRNK